MDEGGEGDVADSDSAIVQEEEEEGGKKRAWWKVGKEIGKNFVKKFGKMKGGKGKVPLEG